MTPFFPFQAQTQSCATTVTVHTIPDVLIHSTHSHLESLTVVWHRCQIMLDLWELNVQPFAERQHRKVRFKGSGVFTLEF